MPRTTPSPSASYLARAIDASGRTQKDIATEVGLKNANALSMMKKGNSNIPVARIPALAEATGADTRQFLRIALAEYHPEVYDVIKSSFGECLTRPEQDLLVTFRLCDETGDIRMNADDVSDLCEVLLRVAARSKGA